MKHNDGPLPALITSTVVAAVLVTVMVQDGWIIWFPVLLALAVTASFRSPPRS